MVEIVGFSILLYNVIEEIVDKDVFCAAVFTREGCVALTLF